MRIIVVGIVVSVRRRTIQAHFTSLESVKDASHRNRHSDYFLHRSSCLLLYDL